MQRLRALSAVSFLAITIACAASDPGITTAVKSKLAADLGKDRSRAGHQPIETPSGGEGST